MSPSRLPGFDKLNDAVSLYRPSHAEGDTSSSRNPDEPSRVVICAWMGAASKHIAKYTDSYRRTWPETEILLIESTIQTMFVGADLTPAVDFLVSSIKNESSDINTDQPVLLHMFSNGGAKNGTDLASRLYELHGAARFDAVVLDSSPGRGEVMAATQAMAFSLPKQPIVRFVGWYLLYTITALYVAMVKAFATEDVISRLSRLLNDTRIFPKQMPKLYLYSKKDALVKYRHVHDHVQEALRAGYVNVKEEVFDTAPHCALLNEDADRYWKAVNQCCGGVKASNGSLNA